MPRLILMRHSEREDNSIDSKISIPNGIDIIANKIPDILEYINIPKYDSKNMHLFASPYARTIESAMCMSKLLSIRNIILEPLIRESYLSHNSNNQLRQPLGDYLANFSCDNNLLETWNLLENRCRLFLDNLEKYDESAIIVAVAHGSILNMVKQIIDPKYEFDKNHHNHTTYIPTYSDFFVFDYDGAWTIQK